jgi:hypothetical protein
VISERASRSAAGFCGLIGIGSGITDG